MNEKLKATLSDFDTQLFGVRVGQLKAEGVVSVRMVREANQDFGVVFVRTTGFQEPHSGNPVALDWTYEMELQNGTNKTIGESNVKPIEGPLATHIAIAESSFVDSRFLRDPMISGKAAELYRRWIMNRAYQLWVLDGPQAEDAFMLQGYDKDDYQRVSLLGVGDKYRGMGLGERLVTGVMARQPTVKGWRVMVAVRNYRALRFYEGLGFRVKSVFTTFHVWI